jgi:hypothetical protein
LVNIQQADNPEAALDLWLAKASEMDQVLVVEYEYSQYYLPGSPCIRLLAIFCQIDGHLYFSVAESCQSLHSQLRGTNVSQEGISLDEFRAFAQLNSFPVLSMGEPLLLQTVSIEKPWGQELWYTGIEERGVSRVTDGLASSLLSWVLSVAPRRLAANCEQQINLLKILDPLSEEIYGDLYFELHEEKREVYVVTHIDRDAWPDGVGAIRYGFDPEVRSTYSCDEAFRADYLAAVHDYQIVRRDIDSQIDLLRYEEGVEPSAPVAAKIMKNWISRLPEQLVEEEKTLREIMNAFTELLPLKEGDVVKVPLLTPHALQHGVRTVEFQTPVYERMILSFAQKVLTQNHWDTDQAMKVAAVATPPMPELNVLESTVSHQLEQVVKFEDFQVLRLTLSPGADYSLPQTQRYGLLLVVDGEVDCRGASIAKECALLLPAERPDLCIANSMETESVVLLASPV